MSTTLVRPTVAHDRHAMAADGFLYSAVLLLALMGVEELLLSPPTAADVPYPPWLEFLSAVRLLVPLVVGVLAAWFLHRRTLSWRIAGLALLGLVGAAIVIVAVFAGVGAVSSLLPVVPERFGPVGLIVVVALATLSLLALPVARAVGELAGRRERLVPMLRLGTLVVLVAATVGSLFIGGETAELGIWLAGGGLVGGVATYLAARAADRSTQA